MWKLKRENSHLGIFCDSESRFLKVLGLQKCQKRAKFKVFTILQKVDFESLHSSKLISRKMRVAEKSSDFHTVCRGNAIQKFLDTGIQDVSTMNNN